ncbi:hypothetical protein EVAR_76637_1 [Eumeta japonica]|uniref:Uncharacterized protein n=1 Tax=Eumeta variegata TaxID=151549 RepID=A0A4C1T565_EUMVA|nr:hypothetical protein EVAR_76637_1 [Eumeta japonica]
MHPPRARINSAEYQKNEQRFPITYLSFQMGTKFRSLRSEVEIDIMLWIDADTRIDTKIGVGWKLKVIFSERRRLQLPTPYLFMRVAPIKRNRRRRRREVRPRARARSNPAQRRGAYRFSQMRFTPGAPAPTG